MKRQKNYQMRKQNERQKWRGSGRLLRKGERNFEKNDNWKDKATIYRKKREIRERYKKISRVKKKEIAKSFKGMQGQKKKQNLMDILMEIGRSKIKVGNGNSEEQKQKLSES